MIFLINLLVRVLDWFDLVTGHLTKNGAQVEFSTDHPSLLAKDSPHETRGILRMHRAGWTGARMSEILGIAQQSLKLQIKDALDEETSASAAKRVIYDARVPKGTR